MNEKSLIKGEWYFEQADGSIQGPFANFITSLGLEKIAERIQAFSAPYLVIGDDTAVGETITEIFRKPVSVINRTGNLIRFRTQLLPSEANGNHQKVSIFVEGSDTAGTGTMLNLLKQPWSKANNTVLTVECKISVQGV